MQQEREAAMGGKKRKREGCRTAGNPASKYSGVGCREGGPEASEVAENPGGVHREWEWESSRRWAPAPPEWKSCPGGTKPP